MAEAEARAQVLEESIRDDIANGREAIATRVEAQRTAERSVVLAKETVDLVQVQYEAGTGTQIDLLQAQFRALYQQVRASAPMAAESDPQHEIPPHY